MIILKNSTKGAGESWQVYHSKNTSAPETDGLLLNTYGGTTDSANRWNDTAPTADVFSVANDDSTNDESETHVAYVFKEIAGYSKFGSYTGEGSTDGPFLYCGFRPAWVMLKRTSSNSNWNIFDAKRDAFNVMDTRIRADDNANEANDDENLDFVSNGIKLRYGSEFNGNDSTNIFFAFAESPFVTSTGTPTNAR